MVPGQARRLSGCCVTVASEVRFDIDLGPLRADGWYEDFLESIEEADLLSMVFGRHGLGYLLLAGVKVESVELDQTDPSGSVIGIGLPDGRIAKAPARLLVRRAVEAIAEQLRLDGPEPMSGDLDEVREYVGARTFLVAALLDIAVSRLRIYVDRRAVVDVTDGDDVRHVDLAEFRETLADRMLEDLATVDEARLDAATLSAAAEAAARGAHDVVLELLEPLANMLASTLRSGHLAGMPQEVRSNVVAAVELLGRAYAAKGDGATAEMLWRLGAQGCKGESEAASLYLRLGESALVRGEAGEAIGTLRRAASLGARPRDFSVPLATALAARGRHVAALSVAQRGIEDGLEAGDFGEALATSRAVAGAPFARILERLRASM